MKKIFIFLGLMFVMLSSTYAQKGRQAIGFGLSYGTEIESAGLGIKYQYNITNPMGVTIMNSVSGLISELGRNSLWDVTGL